MTETIQQKITRIFDHSVNEDGSISIGQIGTDIDKALQEFREQVEDLTPKGIDSGHYLIRKGDVLALLGVKK